MGRPCARQSNIPRPPFPRRNRRDEVHAARSAQTICAFRRGGCHPPAGRTLCAPTLRILFLGRVELQGEVRDMGPGRRCHAAARSRAGSITPTTPPKPTRAWGAPWAFGIRSVVISPVRLRVALKWSHAPIGRIAGSTTPPTPGKPGPAYGRPWALPIRSGVCLPYAPMGRA